MRVLVVEDDPDQRRVLRLVLESAGHEVLECGDLAAARAAGPCDLAIVDRRLPDGDGLALAASIDARAWLLTGEDPAPEIRERADAAGVRILRKPVRPAQIERLLRDDRPLP